jgi:hypothetical protein
MSVIRFLGLGLYSTETLGWIMVVILCASLVMGWIADALLEKLGFGVVGNVVLCLMGMVSGLVVWNFYISLQVTSSLQIIAIATSSAFGCLLTCAGLRRALA